MHNGTSHSILDQTSWNFVYGEIHSWRNLVTFFHIFPTSVRHWNLTWRPFPTQKWCAQPLPKRCIWGVFTISVKSDPFLVGFFSIGARQCPLNFVLLLQVVYQRVWGSGTFFPTNKRCTLVSLSILIHFSSGLFSSARTIILSISTFFHIFPTSVGHWKTSFPTPKPCCRLFGVD